MNNELMQEIAALKKLSMKRLKLRFRELFNEDSPSSNHQHLYRRIAWRLQANAEGDLSQRARERAIELAHDSELRLRAPRAFWKGLRDGKRDPLRDPRVPPVGTVLQRDYQGTTLRVIVAEDGFVYNERTFRSLSAVAQHVTGTRWNGFSFFGLDYPAEKGR
jgi:Protein of unknown function (DUF2924)